jgi:hypothetical protein
MHSVAVGDAVCSERVEGQIGATERKAASQRDAVSKMENKCEIY